MNNPTNNLNNSSNNNEQKKSFSDGLDVDMAALYGFGTDSALFGDGLGVAVGGTSAMRMRMGMGMAFQPGGEHPSMVNNKQPMRESSLQANPSALWNGASINPADFAFSMSANEQAELDRYRKGNTSAFSSTASSIKINNTMSTGNNLNTTSGSSGIPSQIPSHSQTKMMQHSALQNTVDQISSSGALGLQNASMSNSNNLAMSSMLNTNNNLTQQQFQYLLASATQPDLQQNMSQQQQMLQNSYQRQTAQQQQFMQSNMMQQQRPNMNNAALYSTQNPQQIQQYQQQQQQLQNFMMGGVPARSSSSQSNQSISNSMRPPNSAQWTGNNAFPNQALSAVYQQQQQLLLNQQQHLKTQQQQPQQLFLQGQRGGRIQTMNTFDGTVHAAFNDRTQFEVHFAAYVAQLNLPSPPIIMGYSIDVFMLFHTVYQCKGFEEVTRSGGWPVICHRIGLDSSPQTQSAIHAYYQKSMLPLELNTRKGVTAANGAGTPRIADGDLHLGDGVKLEMDSSTAPDEGPNGDVGENEEEEAEEVGKYQRKVRFLKNSIGGIDVFRDLFQLAQRCRANKELFAPRNYYLLDVCLRSGLPAHIRFGLDMLVCVSSELGINFSECSELFGNFILFFQKHIEESFPSIPEQEKGPPLPFRGYEELFEIEYSSLYQLQPNTESSLDPIAQSSSYAIACSLILRNCSLTSNNAHVMANHSGCLALLLKCLDLSSMGGSRVENDDSRHLSSSYPKTLEHRKHALICLANMAGVFLVPSTSAATLIVKVCTDFIQEESGTYRYIALSLLAKSLVNERNHKFFEEARGLVELVEALLGLFSWTGYQLLPSFQVSDMADWEFALTILTVLLTPDASRLIGKVMARIPDLDRILFNLHKRPVLLGNRAISLEFHQFFVSLRERALRILFVLIKHFRRHDVVKHGSWERRLVEVPYSAMNETDSWSVSLIYDFLTAEYQS